MDFKTQLKAWYDWFESRSYREHLYVLVLGLALILYVWLLFVFNHYSERVYQSQSRIKSTKQQIAALQKTVSKAVKRKKTLQKTQQNDPYTEFKKRVAQQGQGKASKQLIVDANEMNQVLKDIVAKQASVRLVYVNTESSEPFSVPGFEGVYKKTLKLKFEGNYFNTLNVLKKLERLPWLVLYDSIQYRVHEYPKARVTLVLLLLSREETWLSAAKDFFNNSVDELGQSCPDGSRSNEGPDATTGV